MAAHLQNQQSPPRPRQRPAPRNEDVGSVMEELHTAYTMLVRAIAGYNTLTRTFTTATGQLADGERAKGVLLKLTGSADDQHAVEVEIDVLKEVAPEEVPYVLVPLAKSQGLKASREVAALMRAASKLGSMIEASLKSGEQNTGGSGTAGAGKDAEDEESEQHG